MILKKRYEVGELINQGGQASIVRAFDSKAKRIVAIKIFDAKTEHGTVGFQTEEQIFKKLSKSKYICKRIDSIQTPELSVIVLKKYDMDLFDYCFANNERVALPLQMRRKIFRQICLGVNDMHKNGVAHLDIKPENILLNENGDAFVCDFASACRVKNRSKNQNGQVTGLCGRGTKNYAAPESVDRNEFDPFKADIYSLGVLLYTISTGVFPTVGSPMDEVEIDKECFSLIKVMLQMNPENRPTIQQVLSHKFLCKSPKFLYPILNNV